MVCSCLWISVSDLQPGRGLSLSLHLAFSASLRTADLFLISGGIANPILQSTAFSGFSDISLGAKRASGSLGALTMSEELPTGSEGHKSVLNFPNPANFHLFMDLDLSLEHGYRIDPCWSHSCLRLLAFLFMVY